MVRVFSSMLLWSFFSYARDVGPDLSKQVFLGLGAWVQSLNFHYYSYLTTKQYTQSIIKKVLTMTYSNNQ